MTFEQRLAQAEPTWQALALLPRLHRRHLIRGVLTDVVGGAESMGELDFAAMCRVRGIPLPARQVLKRGPTGRMFLDAYWPAAHLIVEIDGAHHYVGEAPQADALRQNELALAGDTVIRIPRVALRTNPEPYFQQIAQHLRKASML